jgi:hypothetical protein
MPKRKQYIRAMRLFTPEQEAVFAELKERWNAPSINAVMRACLNIGIPIAQKLPIDKRVSRGMMDTEPNHDGKGDGNVS